MKMRLTVLSFIALFLMMNSCKEETNYDFLFAEEQRYFDLYMNANYPDVTPLQSGLYFIEEKEGIGETPDSGDYVLVNYLAYTLPDEYVVDTYTEDWAEEYGLYQEGVLYGPYKYQHGSEIEGMREGVSMMKEGGVARLIFKSDLGYGQDGLSPIDPFESLMYDIELVEVIKDPAAKEQEEIDNYLATVDNYFEIYDETTDAYMYYIPEIVGDRGDIEDEMEVGVIYKGSLLDGRVFDENTGSTSGFIFTVGEGDVISGWDIGIKSFKYGGTGKLLIPHELAYGEDGAKANNTTKTSVPPFEALLFEIDVDTTLNLDHL